ncbi:AAA ATPase [Paraburkholderia atlantica]|uniref:AAA ATPase n=1 Tax=Paraburkholderia atlantica TaxID=2654982 RepID=D5WBZ6_PARAM|nr:AAA family ATPase [Paraburkholderia atlantica]ADG14551.1 AAA ATPase [Paraburkholderia atlantica]
MSEVRLVRVSTIRSDNPKGFGGYIFYGPTIDSCGTVLDAKEHVVVFLSRDLGIVGLQVGQWWRVTGKATRRERTINGFLIVEQQVHAESAELALPSGEHLVTFIAESDAFPGVGMVKARKLWETFGDRLYSILDEGDESTLSTSVSPETAQVLVDGWKFFGNARTISWLSQHGFEVELGKKVVDYFGAEAPEAISEDPYRLLSFCASWHVTDRLAREHFGVGQDDPRRLRGAIEETLYRLFGDGHTAATDAMVMTRLASVLGDDATRAPRSLVRSALETGRQHGCFVVADDGMLHPLGAYVMETTVASALAIRLRTIAPANSRLLSRVRVEELIAEFESDEQISFSAEQRIAVHLAAENRLCVISGGAGVGKTTILRCIYRVYREASILVIQAALAGRAAKRMESVTGLPARTLAALQRKVTPEQLSEHCVIVVDEASMVDIITMYRLCSLLPPHVRLLLVGDALQLMPVGPGLVLHALTSNSRIPQVHLEVPQRFAGEIARAATSVRTGTWPEIPSDLDAPVVFLRRKPALATGRVDSAWSIAQTVLSLFQLEPKASQILCARKRGKEGVLALNEACQNVLTGSAPCLTIWNSELDALCNTGFRLGDPVVCTRNLYSAGLQNGSLGTLCKIEPEPKPVIADRGDMLGNAIAWIDWDDGECRPVFESLLDHLDLAYALTIHKAQGSQWERVIIPITRHRLLDRTLIYTALTRAQRQVILVGDEEAARHAVESLPRAGLRNTALGSFLEELLARHVAA